MARAIGMAIRETLDAEWKSEETKKKAARG
jgi:hypothetical protein